MRLPQGTQAAKKITRPLVFPPGVVVKWKVLILYGFSLCDEQLTTIEKGKIQ